MATSAEIGFHEGCPALQKEPALAKDGINCPYYRTAEGLLRINNILTGGEFAFCVNPALQEPDQQQINNS